MSHRLVPPMPAPDAPPRGWTERWLAWRDRTVASRRFQRWAAAFPLTRRTAKRRAGALFDLMAGFVYSQVLLACIRLRLFDLLATRPQTLRELAPRLGLTEEAAQRLLSAAVSLGLLERRRGDRFGLGPLGAPLVGNAALAAMIEHHATLYADLADPVALLRADAPAGAMAGYWPYASTAAHAAPAALSAARVAEYSALMSASQPLVAEQLLDAYPLHRHRCLLDVGGGEGTFLCEAAKRAPQLRLMLFDLPGVVELARQRLGEQGLGERASVHGGSFFDDPLPSGADVVTLIRVCFDHPDDRVLRILQSIRRALPVGGVLLLAEPMADTPGAQAMGDAYFGFYLLAMGRGRPRSARQLSELLQRAGFGETRLLSTRMPLQTQVMLARAVDVESSRPTADRNL